MIMTRESRSIWRYTYHSATLSTSNTGLGIKPVLRAEKQATNRLRQRDPRDNREFVCTSQLFCLRQFSELTVEVPEYSGKQLVIT